MRNQGEKKIRELTVSIGDLRVERGKLFDELAKKKEAKRKIKTDWETEKLVWAAKLREAEEKVEATLKKARDYFIQLNSERIRVEGKARLEGVEEFKKSKEGEAWCNELVAEDFGLTVGGIITWVNQKDLKDFSWVGCRHYVEPGAPNDNVVSAGSGTDLSSIPSDDMPLSSMAPLAVKLISSVPWECSKDKGESSSAGIAEPGQGSAVQSDKVVGSEKGLADPGELPYSFADLIQLGDDTAPIIIEGDLPPPTS